MEVGEAALRRRLRRVAQKACNEHPLLIAAGACYVAWRLWELLPSRDELLLQSMQQLGAEMSAPQPKSLPPPPQPAGSSPPARRPSFNLTNERGDLRGSDTHETGWGWQVQEAPLSSRAHGGSALRQQDSSRGDACSKRTVRFQLDASQEFYGFVYEYAGRCVAHGADASFVGLTLPEVLQRTNNTRLDGKELHERFVATAEAGGGWVSYEWRNNASSSLTLRGAYIIKLTKWGRHFYAGVGYSVRAPQQQQPAASTAPSASRRAAPHGLYGFIFDADGVCVAHGASRSFVGKTLGQIIALTDNTQLDSTELLARFIGAAKRGGGWVSYPWRNAPQEPLRSKGAFVSSLERHTGERHKGDGKLGGGGGAPASLCGRSTDELLLRHAFPIGAEQPAADAPPGAAASAPTLYVGFGYFGGDGDGDGGVDGRRSPQPARADQPAQVPPSPAAAKAATAELKRQLGSAADWSDYAPLQAIMHDRRGRLAASAAEAHCWEATELPAGLAEALREHTCVHLGEVDG